MGGASPGLFDTIITIEDSYWLPVSLVVPLGFLLVVLEDRTEKRRRRPSDACEDCDGNIKAAATFEPGHSWSPVSHIGECLDSLDKLLSNGLAVALFCSSRKADASGSGAAATDSLSKAQDAWRQYFWSCKDWIEEKDVALGEMAYVLAREKPLKHLSTVFTLSGDELVWLGLPLPVALVHAATGWGPEDTVGFCVELYGDALGCAVFEQGLKFCFQRERPRYAEQSPFAIVPAEWWSFPSGHSMRAAFVADRLLRKPGLLVALFGESAGASPVVPWLVVLWAVLVAWSRVAKGRHHPVDVICGLIVGWIVSGFVLCLDLRTWGMVRLFLGSITNAEAAVCWGNPELRLDGFNVHIELQVTWWIAQCYNIYLPLSGWQVVALALPVTAIFYIVGSETRSRGASVGSAAS